MKAKTSTKWRQPSRSWRLHRRQDSGRDRGPYLQQEFDENWPGAEFRAIAVESLAAMMDDPEAAEWVNFIATSDPEPRVQARIEVSARSRRPPQGHRPGWPLMTPSSGGLGDNGRTHAETPISMPPR